MGQLLNLNLGLNDLNKSSGQGSRRMAALHSLAQYRRTKISNQKYELIEGPFALSLDCYAITDFPDGRFLIKGVRKLTDEPIDYSLVTALIEGSLTEGEELVEIVDNFTVELVEEEQLLLVNLGPEWLIEIEVDEQNNSYSVQPNPKLINSDLSKRLVILADVGFARI